jgi:hypothetical protein
LTPLVFVAPVVFGVVPAVGKRVLGASVDEPAPMDEGAPEVGVAPVLLLGWDDAPRLNNGGLLAGVAEGVLLPRLPPPRLPNNVDFGVSCVPCVPDFAAPENRPAPED